MGNINRRFYDNTEIRKKIQEKERELWQLYREEMQEDYPEEKITGKIEIDGKEIEIAVELLCPADLSLRETCYDVFHIVGDVRYNYAQAVYMDIVEWAIENFTAEDWQTLADNPEGAETLREKYRDDMEDADQITGNASGTYFFSTARTQYALCGNWEDAQEALDEYETKPKSPEVVDVILRSWWVDRALPYALQELRKAVCEATGRPAPEDAEDTDEDEEENEEATA